MERIPKVNLPRIIDYALEDCKSQQAAAVLKEYQQRPDKNPTRKLLNELRLNPWSFGILTGRLLSLPGGAANPEFPTLVMHQLARLKQLGIPLDQVEIISAIHGSVSDLPETILPEQYNWNTIRGRYKAQNGYILRSEHAHMSCGLSQGDSKNTRKGQDHQIGKLRLLGIHTPVTEVEAIVGKPKEGPFWHHQTVAGEPLPEVNDNRNIEFRVTDSTSGQFAPMNPQQMDNYLHTKTNVMVGGTCMDQRAGATLQHKNVDQIDYGKLSDTIRDESWFARTISRESGPHASLEAIGHNESKIGIMLHDEVGLEMLTIAHWLLTHDQALLIHDQDAPNRFGRLAHARNLIVSLPSTYILSQNFDIIRQQLFGLGSNLLSHVYDNGRAFGLLQTKRATRGFVNMFEETVEVDFDGLQFIYPEDDTKPYLDKMTVAHPVAGWLQDPLHPNPPIRAVYPWSVQPLGTSYRKLLRQH